MPRDDISVHESISGENIGVQVLPERDNTSWGFERMERLHNWQIRILWQRKRMYGLQNHEFLIRSS
jgi:hypothetical protein